MSLLGLDIGTTGCKAIAINDFGNEIAQSYVEYPLVHPQPGWSELNTETIWQSVKKVLAQVAAQTRDDLPEALSVSCQGEAVVPIDEKGNSLYNFSVSFDERTLPQYEWWKNQLGEWRIFQITGMPLHPMYSINKVMWFRDNAPEIYKKTWKFLCVEDYIIFKLTGETAISYSLAARTMAFDIIRKEWSDEILNAAAIDKRLFSTPVPSGTHVGNIRSVAAFELSLPENLKVVTGGHDQPCGALGAGAVEKGLAMNATGTSDVICPFIDKPILTKKLLNHNFCCYPHVLDDQYCSIGFNLSGGLLLRWYRDVLCGEEQSEARMRGCDPYELIIAAASERIARPLILPHFVGSGTPKLDPHSKGAIVNLTIDTDKAELNRAVLDSINYEMYSNIRLMKKSGVTINKIRAIGGGAKSDRWLQLKADVFNMPVERTGVSEAASFGAALLAGKAIGKYSNLAKDTTSLVKVNQVFYPDEQQHRKYEEVYKRFQKIYAVMRHLNHTKEDFS